MYKLGNESSLKYFSLTFLSPLPVKMIIITIIKKIKDNNFSPHMRYMSVQRLSFSFFFFFSSKNKLNIYLMMITTI